MSSTALRNPEEPQYGMIWVKEPVGTDPESSVILTGESGGLITDVRLSNTSSETLRIFSQTEGSVLLLTPLKSQPGFEVISKKPTGYQFENLAVGIGQLVIGPVGPSSTTASSTIPSRWLPPTWLQNVTARVTRFSHLHGNWDTYGGKPISRAAIAKAIGIATLFADRVSREGVSLPQPPFVAPMSSGGLLFEIRNGVRELHIEIEPGDSDRYQVCRIGSELSGGDLEETVGKSGIPEVLSWILNVR